MPVFILITNPPRKRVSVLSTIRHNIRLALTDNLYHVLNPPHELVCYRKYSLLIIGDKTLLGKLVQRPHGIPLPYPWFFAAIQQLQRLYKKLYLPYPPIPKLHITCILTLYSNAFVNLCLHAAYFITRRPLT